LKPLFASHHMDYTSVQSLSTFLFFIGDLTVLIVSTTIEPKQMIHTVMYLSHDALIILLFTN
jgi:hypothetical protein